MLITYKVLKLGKMFSIISELNLIQNVDIFFFKCTLGDRCGEFREDCDLEEGSSPVTIFLLRLSRLIRLLYLFSITF